MDKENLKQQAQGLIDQAFNLGVEEGKKISTPLQPKPDPTPAPQPDQWKVAFYDKPKWIPGETRFYKPSKTIKIAKGETAGLLVKVLEKTEILGNGEVTVKVFKPSSVLVSQKSASTSVIGAYQDPLIPVSGPLEPGDYWLDVSVNGPLSSANFNWGLTVVQRNFALPQSPSLPISINLDPWKLVQGHSKQAGMEGGQFYVKLQKMYVAQMLSHRVNPYNHFTFIPSVKSGRIDIDEEMHGAGSSFRKLVMNSSPNFVMFPMIDDATYLKALESTIQLESLKGKAWLYVMDEPDLTLSSVRKALKTLLAKIKMLTPSALTMVTIHYDRDLAPLVDRFCPVNEYMDNNPYGPPPFSAYRGLKVWNYYSCMSNGCGGAAIDSGGPDLALDRTPAHVCAAHWNGSKYELEAMIYYASTESYGMQDPWIDPWVRDAGGSPFSSNQDGVLFYPGIPGEKGFTEHMAIPSIRLKLLRQGSNDSDYIALARAKNKAAADAVVGRIIKTNVSIETDWEKYEKAREDLAQIIEASS